MGQYGPTSCEGIWKEGNLRIAKCEVKMKEQRPQIVFYGYADIGGGLYRDAVSFSEKEMVSIISNYKE